MGAILFLVQLRGQAGETAHQLTHSQVSYESPVWLLPDNKCKNPDEVAHQLPVQ